MGLISRIRNSTSSGIDERSNRFSRQTPEIDAGRKRSINIFEARMLDALDDDALTLEEHEERHRQYITFCDLSDKDKLRWIESVQSFRRRCSTNGSADS